MCVTPITIMVRGIETGISCRKCWQCNSNRIRDWVGRCIAESKTSVATSVVTLTYGEDSRLRTATALSASVLNYRDIQLYLMRLRKGIPPVDAKGERLRDKDGALVPPTPHPVRYLIAGEHGAERDRAHWHAILFWQEREPNHPHQIRTMDHREWGHGFTYWDDFSEKAAAYACKYILKDVLNDEGEVAKQSHFMMSKKPVLGHDYFIRLAHRYVKQGLLPQKPLYWFSDVRDRETGRPREFQLQGAALDVFSREFLDEWERVYGYDAFKYQHSPFLMDYLDRVATPGVVDGLERRGFVPRPSKDAIPEGGVVTFNETRNVFELLTLDGEILYWSFNEKGQREWCGNIVAPSDAVTSATMYARQQSPDEYRRVSNGE